MGTWTVLGPTTPKIIPNSPWSNLLICRDDITVATVRLDPEHPKDSVKLATVLARAHNRTLILQHLLTELEQSDEGQWADEIRLIRDELHLSEDDEASPARSKSAASE
jgi:hypothetical protein